MDTERKRYGRRAPGQTQTTISLSEEMFLAAKAEAQRRGISLSKLIELALAEAQPSKSKKRGAKGKE